MENIITRGTTPTLNFKLPMAADTLAVAFITFSQQGKVVFEKTLSDCTMAGETLSVQLSQEETLLLDDEYKTTIQIRARDRSGNAPASKIFAVETGKIQKEGVI